MLYRALFTTLIAISASIYSVTAHLDHDQAEDSNQPFSAAQFPEIQNIMQGNAQFRQQRNETQFRTLVEKGQKPSFALITCSDSRLPEATIFNSEPGTFFVERNIANQYKLTDQNAQSVISYGVRVLGVHHIIVLGHYACGGVAAAIATPPRGNIDASGQVIQSWISDIRRLYLTSNRTEVVEMRNANQAREARGELVAEPDRRNVGFRALVEENVKEQVERLATSSLITNHNTEVINLSSNGSVEGGKTGDALPLTPVFIHGWVHDIETGEVIDLNVSTGPSSPENFVSPR